MVVQHTRKPLIKKGNYLKDSLARII